MFSLWSQAFAEVPVSVQVQQVAQLVERPIEIVEYQQQRAAAVLRSSPHSSLAREYRTWSRLGSESASAVSVAGNYGHLPYENSKNLWELGDINIGVGTLQATNTRVYEAVEPTVQSCENGFKTSPRACG